MVLDSREFARERSPVNETDEAQQRLDDAIADCVKATGDQGSILTGWVLCGSVQHPRTPGSDGYFTQHSQGLPYHSQIGLLTTSIDEKKNLVLVHNFMGKRR
jgi:hypothetical protein